MCEKGTCELYRTVLNNFLDVYRKEVPQESLLKENFGKTAFTTSIVGLLPSLFYNYNSIEGIGSRITSMIDKAYDFWNYLVGLALDPKTYELLSYMGKKIYHPETITPQDEITGFLIAKFIESYASSGLENTLSNLPYYAGIIGIFNALVYGGLNVCEKFVNAVRFKGKANPAKLSDSDKKAVVLHGIFRYPGWINKGEKWEEIGRVYEEKIKSILGESFLIHDQLAEIYSRMIDEEEGLFENKKEEVIKAENYFQQVFLKELQLILHLLGHLKEKSNNYNSSSN